MWKVMKIDQDNQSVIIVEENEHTLEQYPMSCCNESLQVGDYVDVFRSKDGKTVLIGRQEKSIDEVFSKEQSQYPKTTVNKYIYFILAFFFGGLGFQFFYAHNNEKGMKYLLLSIFLFWTVLCPLILWILSMIDAVHVLALSSDASGEVEL